MQSGKKRGGVPAEVKEGQTALFQLSYCKQESPSQSIIAAFFGFFFFIPAGDFHLKWSSGVVLKCSLVFQARKGCMSHGGNAC